MTLEEKIKAAELKCKAVAAECRAAERVLKKLEKRMDREFDRLTDLRDKQLKRKWRKEDLSGINGVVFTLTSTPTDLFEKPKKATFVLYKSQSVSSNHCFNYCRFWCRPVGERYATGSFFTVYPGIKSAQLLMGDGWYIPRDQLIEILESAVKNTAENHFIDAYPALKQLLADAGKSEVGG